MALPRQRKPAFIDLDQFDYHHVLAASKGLSLVVFTKPGCGSCRQWLNLLMCYQSLHPAIGLFRVDSATEAALAHELEVFHLPALFLYVEGHFHAEIQAEARLSRLEQAIQQALASPPQEQP